MKKEYQQKRAAGFTIIEVLIVLAIAGLILLIVFLAVPALQRNQRNTARKNDVARIGGAATEFVSNNNGTMPVGTDNTTISNSAGTLAQYDFKANPAKLIIVTQATAGATTITAIDTMRIVTAAQCGASGVTSTGSPRQLAIQYAVENSTSATTGTPACVAL